MGILWEDEAWQETIRLFFRVRIIIVINNRGVSRIKNSCHIPKLSV